MVPKRYERLRPHGLEQEKTMATQTSDAGVATTKGVKFGQNFLSLTRIALGFTFL